VLGLDEQLAELGGGGLVLALAVALLLGIRHATDPDHLTALATLIVGDDEHGARRARRLALAWGLGHGTTLFAFGLPVVLAGSALPERVEQAAELAIGAVICALALRLLARWRAGELHSHPHSHGGRSHAHPHVHEPADGGEHHAHAPHEHAHEERLGRTPRAAWAIGVVHGIGGSAGAGILLVGAAADGAPAVAVLALFAAGTALSMALVSAGFGYAIARGALAHRVDGLVPAMAAGSLLFGLWYAAAALHAAPYPL
jgi:ABC-type nickel/cobalt efflux system permease component RcnA